MKSAVETLTPTRVKLSVEVSAEELKPRLDAAYASIGANVNIPGFRRGKVPTQIIDQRVGRGAVVQEAVNEAMGEYYSAALVENDLRPLGQPEVNITELPLEDGQELKFETEVDVVPAIELPDYSGIAVQVDPVEVSEEDVQTRMDNLRARFGTLVGVDRPAQDGDFTSIDLSASIDGESIDDVTGVSYEIGSGTMLEGLDEALIGHSAGDTVEFASPLAGGDRAGENADITVTLGTVKERQLPDLDDEFAQLASQFDTFAELEADVRSQTERAVKFEQGVQARDRVLEAMLEQTEIPVPENVVEAEVHRHLEEESRLEDEEHRAEVTESTTKSLRTQFLLDALVRRDEIEVTQPELIEYLIMAAQQSGMNPNDFAQAVDQNGQVPALAAEVARRKALAGILEGATVTDTSGAAIDLDELAPQAEGDEAESDPALSEGAGPADLPVIEDVEGGEQSQDQGEAAEGDSTT